MTDLLQELDAATWMPRARRDAVKRALGECARDAVIELRR